MATKFSWELFEQLPVVGILRGFDAAAVTALLDAATAGGLVNVEITMNTAGAAELIRQTVRQLGEHANIGAGTVCSLDDLDAALEAGATFIVTPVIVPEVIEECVGRQVPVFPGAMTPTEIHQASQLGAAMVKVFPADQLGPGYIKSVKAPLPHIRLLPTGGITVENLAEFKRAGADGFGVGSPLFDPQRVAQRDWNWVRQQAERFVEAYRAATLP